MGAGLDRKKIASVLEEIGTLLELTGENPFKSRAYASAARTLEGLADDQFEAIVRESRIRELKGIGEALSEKIETLARTGSLPYHDELRRAVPPGLLEMIQIPGLGPKRARALHDGLGIESVEQLAAACREGRLATLAGFGPKLQETLLEGIAFLGRQAGLGLLSEASRIASELIEALVSMKGVSRAQAAGSLRRRKELVRDVDLLAGCTKGASPASIIRQFTRLPGIERILGAGETKASVVTSAGRQVDLRVVRDDEYPFALNYFTGSKEHNIELRRRAQTRGLKINEYGLWKGARRLACRDEEAIYAKLGLSYIPPELRESWGEIEAAEAGRLPELVRAEQIRGVFHVHSNWSDGVDSLEAMVQRAAQMGLEYVGMSEHSRSAGYAGGLSPQRVASQREEIARLRRKYPGIRILHGTESDILKDGSLDYPDDLLATFDFVVGSIHSSFTLPEQEQTRRVVRAIQHPRFTILGHPTGRLLLQREGFRIDLDEVIAQAARSGKLIEINAHPLRLDLDWRHCRKAKQAGVMVAIDPDAHSVDGLADVAYGVDTARRGWLEASDVANTRSWEEVRAMIGKAA